MQQRAPSRRPIGSPAPQHRWRRRALAVAVTVPLATAGMVGMGAASASAKTVKNVKVNLCHATNSDSNPYTFITVADDSVEFQGHLMHRNSPNKIWKNATLFNGVLHAAGSAKPDIIATYTDENGLVHTLDGTVTAATCNGLGAPPALSITVVKTNDADRNGTFHGAETAPTAGADVNFQAVITNTSPIDVVIGSITDQYSAVTAAKCPGLIGKTLIAGASVTCSFTITGYAPAAGSSLTDTVTAVVTQPGVPANTATGSSTSTVSTPAAAGGNSAIDLAIVKTASAPVVRAGDPLTYTLQVSNVGNAPTTGPITVTDTLPAGETLTSATGTGWTCTAVGAAISCTYTGAALAAGAAASPITIVTGTTLVAVPKVTNTGKVTTPDDTNSGNDSSTVNTPVLFLDLAVTKTGPASLTAGKDGTYGISVRNVGTLPAAGPLTVTDTLPAGETFVSASGDGWSCTAAGAALTCTRTAGLTSGASSAFTLTVAVDSTVTDSLTNVATIHQPGDINPANDTSTVITPVTVVQGVTITKLPVVTPPVVKPPVVKPPVVKPPVVKPPVVKPPVVDTTSPLPTTVEGLTVSRSTDALPTTVEGLTVSRGAGTLPFTGAATLDLLEIALSLLGAGTALVVLGRRRRRPLG